MKKLLISLVVFSILFVRGCQENSITDPISGELIQKIQTTSETFTSGVIPLEGILIVPGGFQTYYDIQGQINYTHELVFLDPAPPAPQYYIDLNLSVRASLTDEGHNAFRISSQSQDNIYVSEDGIYKLEKSFPVLVLKCDDDLPTSSSSITLADRDSNETMKPLSWLLLLSWLVAPAQAALYSPRILSPHNADIYSLKTFAQFDRWRDLSGDAKVYEVFKYLADRRTGLYPMGVPAREGREDLPEYGAVTDPVKMLNVYPIGHCGTLGPAAAGLWEGMGHGPARTLILPSWNHVAAEVFCEGRWHYFDLDLRAVFRSEDGTLASMDEARADASLWRQPNRGDPELDQHARLRA